MIRPLPKRASIAVLTALCLLCACRGEESSPPTATSEPSFVGSAACAECHPEETRRWRGSHHDLAMQEATSETVLGDFDGTPFAHAGVASEFLRRDGGFAVRTDGPDGRPAEYEIAYVFGVEPLQQYLIRAPGGRLQALGLAWDARPADQGGQRWFHLYPDPTPVAGEPLHWTGADQTWNFMCASCHSTGLEAGYDAQADRYQTARTSVHRMRSRPCDSFGGR